MKFKLMNESSFKSGDRYYGGLPSEPSASEYGNAMNAANEYQQSLIDKYDIKVEKSSGQIMYTGNIDDHEFTLIENTDGLSHYVNELIIDGIKVDIYKSPARPGSIRNMFEVNASGIGAVIDFIEKDALDELMFNEDDSITESTESNQYGVHQFSTNSIIFRGSEEECGKYIDERPELWDDAEVYSMTNGDPHYLYVDLREDLDDEKICCICKEPYEGYGNNAEPVCSGRCCDKCNYERVIPMRFKMMKESTELNEGNPVSGKIPESIDSFLQDIAQMYETIDYGDIMDHDYSEEDIKKLKSLRRKFREEAQYEGDEEAEAAMNDIAKKVAAILKTKNESKELTEDIEDYKLTYYLATATAERRPETIDDVENDWQEEVFEADSDYDACKYAFSVIHDVAEEDVDDYISDYGINDVTDFITYCEEKDLGDGSAFVIKLEGPNGIIYDMGYDKQSYIDEFVSEDSYEDDDFEDDDFEDDDESMELDEATDSDIEDESLEENLIFKSNNKELNDLASAIADKCFNGDAATSNKIHVRTYPYAGSNSGDYIAVSISSDRENYQKAATEAFLKKAIQVIKELGYVAQVAEVKKLKNEYWGILDEIAKAGRIAIKNDMSNNTQDAMVQQPQAIKMLEGKIYINKSEMDKLDKAVEDARKEIAKYNLPMKERKNAEGEVEAVPDFDAVPEEDRDAAKNAYDNYVKALEARPDRSKNEIIYNEDLEELNEEKNSEKLFRKFPELRKPVNEEVEEDITEDLSDGTYKITYYLSTATRNRRPETREDIDNDYKVDTIHATGDFEAMKEAFRIQREIDESDVDFEMEDYDIESVDDFIRYFEEDTDWGDGSILMLKVEGPDGVIYDTGYNKDTFIKELDDNLEYQKKMIADMENIDPATAKAWREIFNMNEEIEPECIDCEEDIIEEVDDDYNFDEMDEMLTEDAEIKRFRHLYGVE